MSLEIEDAIIQELYRIHAVKLGQFTLKSGKTSPVYIDLRVTISYPRLLQQIGEALYQKIQTLPIDCLCGVPYTALPIATSISLAHNIPMLMRRKEAKRYGTKRLIEGHFSSGQHCVVIEDVITSGSSVLETIQLLRDEKLVVNQVAVFMDRNQGGRAALEAQHIQVHAVFELRSFLKRLTQVCTLTPEEQGTVLAWANSL